MRKFAICLIAILFFTVCSASSETAQSSAEQEIRVVLCKIKNRDYSDAERGLEKILKKEPQNIYAQRLTPGVFAEQIKKDDKSIENIAQITKTIVAYQQALKNPQL